MKYNPDTMIKKCTICNKQLKEGEGRFIVFIGTMCTNCYSETIKLWRGELSNVKNSSVCK